MFERFKKDLIKYSKYIKYSTKSQLKAEITGSYLSWMWLFIEPICFMLIYSFIAEVVFNSNVPYFAVFIFIGLTIWTFFQKTLKQSVKLISSNRDTVTKVYLPKFVLLITKVAVNGVKFLISFSLVIISMIIFQVPISINVLYFLLICAVLLLVTFGFSLFFMHLGVFIKDLNNITDIALRMLFYMSGIFFALEQRVPSPYNEILVKVNPIAACIVEARNVLLFKTAPDFLILGIWGIIGLILCYYGIRTIYKYENTYVKVMK